MRNAFILLVGLALVGGCATSDDMDMTMTGPMVWKTSLKGSSGWDDVKGTAEAHANRAGTSVAVGWRGKGNHTHPWHVHEGTCGSGGPIVGDASAYTPLRAGSDGGATASATIMVPLQSDKSYYVNIHKSPSDLGTIVACGQLTLANM